MKRHLQETCIVDRLEREPVERSFNRAFAIPAVGLEDEEQREREREDGEELAERIRHGRAAQRLGGNREEGSACRGEHVQQDSQTATSF